MFLGKSATKVIIREEDKEKKVYIMVKSSDLGRYLVFTKSRESRKNTLVVSPEKSHH